MRVVAALGGNALLRRGEVPTVEAQRSNAARAARALAQLGADHELVVTHGNGPQIGLLAMQTAAFDDMPIYPLDVLGAQSQGMIGYVLEQELRMAMPGREVATLLTQTVVSADDPALLEATKYVGPGWPEAEARRLAAQQGWTVKQDGDLWRRVVPSPAPKEVLSVPSALVLLQSGAVVVCGGGGGVPVVRDPSGAVRGVEAVVDKDRLSALLADRLGADALLFLTDVDAVYAGWGTDEARALRQAHVDDLKPGGFDPGSMGPKVEAARRFVMYTGRLAAIGAMEQAADILAGNAGTRVVR